MTLKMGPVLELRGVTKSFGEHRAVDDVSVAVEPGTLFALVGPSGCGKTTTLRLVAGFEQPNSGDVLLDGRPIGHLPPYRRDVSTVFQSYALFPHMTARENIEFGLRRKGANGIDERVREMIELVRLDGKQNHRPAQLSGGEKQRVALARSLALAPRAEEFAAPDRHDVRHGDARSGRGDVDGGPDRGDESRPD
jgi:ABC-type Fe3+/spermidine/putrescine transport system ATPase subunit